MFKTSNSRVLKIGKRSLAFNALCKPLAVKLKGVTKARSSVAITSDIGALFRTKPLA